MAPSVNAEQFEGSVPKSPLPLFVKNTFIDVEDEAFEVDPRRSSSEPPSCRHSGHSSPRFAFKSLAEDSDGSGSTASGPGSPRGSISDATSDDGMPLTSAPPSPTVNSQLNPHAAVWSPALRPIQYLSPPQHSPEFASLAQLPPPPPPPPETSILAMIPGCFLQEFKDLFSSAASALSSNDVVDVRSFETIGVWGKGMKIAGSMRPETPACDKEAILERVQGALLKAAEESQSVYVMGYALRPFTPTDDGFAAMLGGMHDDGWACWDMLQKGFCARKGACCKQHPASMIPIYVEIDGQPLM